MRAKRHKCTFGVFNRIIQKRIASIKRNLRNTKEINPTKKRRDLMARESSEKRAYRSEM